MFFYLGFYTLFFYTFFFKFKVLCLTSLFFEVGKKCFLVNFIHIVMI